MILDYLSVAFLMVRAKPVRSTLSWLGIYIGVLALIIILAIHEGSRRELEDLYRVDGARVVLVRPGFARKVLKMGRLGLDDVTRLSVVPGVQSILPRLTDEREVRSAKAAQHVRVIGIDEVFVSLYRIPVLKGRTFLAPEVETRQPICLLTQDIAEELFPFSEAVNATVNLQGVTFQVVGVVGWKPGISQRASLFEDPQILVPVPWMFKNGSGGMLSALEVRLRPDIRPDQAVEAVNRGLTNGDASRSQLYMVRTIEQSFEQKKKVSERALISLLAIAGVSLLVGGIGIANVMLTSVTERTREVGIRKALGATRKDILLQFLVESSVLCAGGGLMAVLSGWLGISAMESIYPDKFSLAVPKALMAACFVLTVLIGVISGLYPASRAASLSPAEALRYE